MRVFYNIITLLPQLQECERIFSLVYALTDLFLHVAKPENAVAPQRPALDYRSSFSQLLFLTNPCAGTPSSLECRLSSRSRANLSLLLSLLPSHLPPLQWVRLRLQRSPALILCPTAQQMLPPRRALATAPKKTPLNTVRYALLFSPHTLFLFHLPHSRSNYALLSAYYLSPALPRSLHA